MRDKFIQLLMLVFVMTVLLFFSPAFIATPISLNFLNVGNGDSILVTKGTQPLLLIDGGPDYSVDYFLSRYFPFLNCRLPYIFLTHPHSDHLVGLLKVVEHCEVQTVYENEIEYDSSIYLKWKNIFGNKKSKDLLSELKINTPINKSFPKGSQIGISGLKIISLYPPENKIDPTKPPKNVNDISMVLLLDYGKFEALLLGDLESYNQQFIDMALYNQYVDPPLEVLKVSHHGAEKALNPFFTSKILPLTAVLTTGPNKYGHPSPTVIAFLKERGVRVLRTDEVGDISIPMISK